MAYRRGDVLLVPFPFSDLSTSKVRPAVVVSSDTYHATEPDLLLAALTTKVNTATRPTDYVLADWAQAGLRYSSALKLVLFTLAPERVEFRIGALTVHDLAEVDRRLRLALALEISMPAFLSALNDLSRDELLILRKQAEERLAA
jgi:mRNA interferase MazF